MSADRFAEAPLLRVQTGDRTITLRMDVDGKPRRVAARGLAPLVAVAFEALRLDGHAEGETIDVRIDDAPAVTAVTRCRDVGDSVVYVVTKQRRSDTPA